MEKGKEIEIIRKDCQVEGERGKNKELLATLEKERLQLIERKSRNAELLKTLTSGSNKDSLLDLSTASSSSSSKASSSKVKFRFFWSKFFWPTQNILTLKI